jgi:GDPmannose 4,6-dehydratase
MGSQQKTALVTGITGQDGSYLAELLLAKGYAVHGVIRRASSLNTSRIAHLLDNPRLVVHFGDLSDSSGLIRLVSETRPDEIYNLAAQSHVLVSFDEPELTGDTTGLGSIRLLEAIRILGLDTRFYQASSSEMFGASPPPQNEETPFYPRSPYGAAKVYSFWITKNYRESYNLFATNGILFNHESPRRGETFVTRKITRAVARIKAGVQDKLFLGNLDAIRDWGYAPEFVEAMWLIMQADTPDDFVVATNSAYSVKDFLGYAFGRVGLDWEKFVEFDEALLRPAEVDALVGDSSKVGKVTGWAPQVLTPELAEIMVDADIKILESEGQHWYDSPYVR